MALKASGLAPGGYNLLGEDAPAPFTLVTLTRTDDGAARGSGQQGNLPWQGDHEGAHTYGIKTFLEGRATDVLLTAEVEDSCGTVLFQELEVKL